MVAIAKGHTDWKLTMDKDGHRDYTIDWFVEATSASDGPATILRASGLPTVGSVWSFGNDVDLWAFCWPNWTATPVQTNEPNYWWKVSQLFTTKPLSRCQDNSIENPIMEPDRINGTFVKYVKEVTEDRFGNALKTSSHEMIRGSIVEFDHNRPTVTIEKNVLTLPLATFAPMIDTVNDSTLWGLPARTVKLSSASFQRKLYGTCSYYYVIRYDFDIDYRTFDRNTLDEGSRVLSPGGDKTKPTDFEVYKDRNGENTRVLLDGEGNALDDGENPVTIPVSHYDESNMFVLNIPAAL